MDQGSPVIQEPSLDQLHLPASPKMNWRLLLAIFIIFFLGSAVGFMVSIKLYLPKTVISTTPTLPYPSPSLQISVVPTTSDVCTADVQQCPDGSWVGRLPPDCKFASCPGENTTPSTVRPTWNEKDVIRCSEELPCPSGMFCSDMPVYRCYPNDYKGSIPICLSSSTRIKTVDGDKLIRELKLGEQIWTTNKLGKPILQPIIKIASSRVSKGHLMRHIFRADGKEIIASLGHPTADGRIVGDLKPGDFLDGAPVVSTETVSYSEQFTYDVLAAGETGTYWANGILLKSTLH